MKYSIVILHYNLLKETIDCVNSFKNLNNKDHQVNIIIVDNCSPNHSGEELTEYFRYDDNIDIILNKENLGFARGNNVGYQFSIHNYNPDFIIFSNNDVEVEEEYFFDLVEKRYKEVAFSVLGPDIYNPLTKVHQSPLFVNKIIDKKYVQERLLKIQLRIFREKLFRPFPRVGIKVNNIYQKKKQKDKKYKEIHHNSCLHGSFLVFSKLFIDKFPRGIFEETFMYGEEEILLYFCQQEGLRIEYFPSIQINHYEEASTSNVYEKAIYKKQMFKNKQMKKSIILLRNLINNY